MAQLLAIRSLDSLPLELPHMALFHVSGSDIKNLYLPCVSLGKRIPLRIERVFLSSHAATFKFSATSPIVQNSVRMSRSSFTMILCLREIGSKHQREEYRRMLSLPCLMDLFIGSRECRMKSEPSGRLRVSEAFSSRPQRIKDSVGNLEGT